MYSRLDDWRYKLQENRDAEERCELPEKEVEEHEGDE